MILKKKNGKDIEIQDGWKGKIIPFELVQDYFLKELKETIDKKNNRLEEIKSNCSEIIEELTEEEKDSLKNILNEESDAFKNSEIIKLAKTIEIEDQSEDIKQIVLKVNGLINEEKQLSNELKEDGIKLLEETKSKIESLTGEEIYKLLNKKWIEPTVNSINKITQNLINDFIKNIEKLSEKYQKTLADIEKDIRKTEKELSNMIDELTANEYDMKGLMEFKSLLEGELNDR